MSRVDRHSTFQWPYEVLPGQPFWQSRWFIWPVVLACFAALAGVGAWAASKQLAPSTQAQGSYLMLLSDADDEAALATGQSIPWITAQYIALNVVHDVAVGCARLASVGEITTYGSTITGAPQGALDCEGWVYWTPALEGPVAASIASSGTVFETPYTPSNAPAASDRHAAWVIVNAPTITQAREVMFVVGFAVIGIWTLPTSVSALTPPLV